MTRYDWQTTVAFAHRYACACIPGYVDDECEALRAKLAAGVAEEREACARVADAHDEGFGLTPGVDTGQIWRSAGARSIAGKIRQRAVAVTV